MEVSESAGESAARRWWHESAVLAVELLVVASALRPAVNDFQYLNGGESVFLKLFAKLLFQRSPLQFAVELLCQFFGSLLFGQFLLLFAVLSAVGGSGAEAVQSRLVVGVQLREQGRLVIVEVEFLYDFLHLLYALFLCVPAAVLSSGRPYHEAAQCQCEYDFLCFHTAKLSDWWRNGITHKSKNLSHLDEWQDFVDKFPKTFVCAVG